MSEGCLGEKALMGCVMAQLPNGWLWDMVDEFVYQFQSWQQYRGKLNTKSAEELETLRNCDRVWSILSVLNYLQALVDKSGIVAELSTPGEFTFHFAIERRAVCSGCWRAEDGETAPATLPFKGTVDIKEIAVLMGCVRDKVEIEGGPSPEGRLRYWEGVHTCPQPYWPPQLMRSHMLC